MELDKADENGTVLFHELIEEMPGDEIKIQYSAAIITANVVQD